jgi:spore germination protein GerM
MESKQIFVLSSLMVLLIVLVILYIAGGREQTPPPEPVPSPDEAGEPGEPRETRTVTLYFLSDDDMRLHSETREILVQEQDIFEVKQTLEELVRGPSDDSLSPIPSGTRLREVYISREGVAYVDFSRELRDNHPSGSRAEISTVFAIVNSLTQNFKSVRRVFILIEGTERETLNGHVDLTRPLLPRLDLIAD